MGCGQGLGLLVVFFLSPTFLPSAALIKGASAELSVYHSTILDIFVSTIQHLKVTSSVFLRQFCISTTCTKRWVV